MMRVAVALLVCLLTACAHEHTLVYPNRGMLGGDTAVHFTGRKVAEDTCFGNASISATLRGGTTIEDKARVLYFTESPDCAPDATTPVFQVYRDVGAPLTDYREAVRALAACLPTRTCDWCTGLCAKFDFPPRMLGRITLGDTRGFEVEVWDADYGTQVIAAYDCGAIAPRAVSYAQVD